MSNESSRNEAVRVQWDSLGFLSLSFYFQNQRFFLAVIFSICSLNFWARPACIWRLHRQNQGRDTTLEVLTLRHGLFNCWERKQWKQNTLHCCSQEFTLLNQDSADTHRLLSFLCAGCSSSFSTPTKAAVSFRHLLFPLIALPRMSAAPVPPASKHIRDHKAITNSITSSGEHKTNLHSVGAGSQLATGQPKNQKPLWEG